MKMKLNKIFRFCILVFLVMTLIPLITSKAILNKPPDWYVGDQHIHSEYSCFGEPDHCDTPIEDNANAAKNSRFDWMIITDHGFMIPTCGGWNGLKTECNAEDTSSFKCMRGEEVGYWSHLLAYDSPDLETRVESCDLFGGDHDCWQQEVDDITSQGGMAAIAHPYYSDADWNDWTVTGWEGLEIRNGVYTSDDVQAFERWKELIGGGEKITALGNSDAHHAETIGGPGVYFVYCWMTSGLEESRIETALDHGRCVVSNGPLVIATLGLGGAKIGQTASLCPGIHNLNINAYADSTQDNEWGELNMVHIYVNNEDLTSKSLSGYTDSETIPITVLPGVKFIRLSLSTTGGTEGKKYAYTNPIWVNVIDCEYELCDDGIDNNNNGYIDCADGDCADGDCTEGMDCGADQWCCGSGCSTDGGSCSCVGSGGITCIDENCDFYGESCCDTKLQKSLQCSGTSLTCTSGQGTCESKTCGASDFCDEKNPGDESTSTDECCYGSCTSLDCDSDDDSIGSDGILKESEVTLSLCTIGCSSYSTCCDQQSKTCSAIYECDYFHDLITNEDETPNNICYRSNAGSWKFASSAESIETICSDGNDNDCDRLIDYNDTADCILDIIPPYFTDGTPQPQTLTYGENLNYDINATDETSFDCFAVNDSRFKINCDGLLENNSVLGVAEYYINITINDTAGNLNFSEMLVNVTKANPILTKYLNSVDNNLTIVYPQKINASAYTTGGEVKIYRNGVDVSSENSLNVSLGVGYYEYEFNVSGNQNYSDLSSVYLYANVTKATAQTSLVFDKTSPQTYGTSINATCSIISGEGSAIFFRDEVDVTITENNQDIILGAGSYNYECNMSETQNYTSATNQSSFTINQATLLGSLTNDRSWTFEYDEVVANIGYSESNTGDDDIVYKIFKDNVDKSSSDSEAGVGTYSYKLNSTSGQNYSANSSIDAQTLTINQNNTYALTINANPSWNETYGTSVNVSGSGCPSQLSCKLFKNDSSEISNEQDVVYGGGNYNFTYNTTGNNNYSSASVSDVLVINKATGEVYLFINNSRANFSAEAGTANKNIWLNVSLNNGVGDVKLYVDGILYNKGSSPLFNLTNLSVGYYNITGVYEGNENYTSDAETWWVNVVDTTPPNITSVIVFNESGSIDGDVMQGENVTFNVTVTDEGIGVESVWLKIWQGAIGISAVIWQGFLNFVSGNLWTTEVQTNESFSLGDVNYTVYSNDTLGNEANANGSFNITPNPLWVSNCKTLDQSNTEYKLINNIINNDLTDNCINITASNVTLDCRGYYIKSDDNYAGIYSNQPDTTIKNCNISMGNNGTGIKLDDGANNSRIINNIVWEQYYGLRLHGELYQTYISGLIVENNTIINNTGGLYFLFVENSVIKGNDVRDNEVTGISLYYSDDNNISENSVNNSGKAIRVEYSNDNSLSDNLVSNSDYGIYIYYAFENKLIRESVEGNVFGVYILNSSNNVIRDSDLSSSSSDVYLLTNSLNNSFVNCSLSSEYVGTGSQLFRKWYYRAYVNDSDGNSVNNANVKSYNVSNNLVLSLVSSASGWTSIGEIVDYVNNGTRTYYSNYMIKASNSTHYDSHSYNVTLEENKFDDVFSLSAVPDDNYKFYVKNDIGENIAWFGDEGNIVLEGSCSVSANCVAPTNLFVIQNNTGTVAYINEQGNLCIEKGDCSDESASCNSIRETAFLIKNSSNVNMSYIDFDGDLCLIGGLYENVEL